MARIFICYSRKNAEDINLLIHDIEELGHRVWYDQELSGGQSWWDHVLEEIRRCNIFVFALSQDSLNSYACKLEREYAGALGKTIFPVATKNDYSLYSLTPDLLKLQVINYNQRDIDTAIKLAKSLCNISFTDTLPDPLPTPPDMPLPLVTYIYNKLESPSTLSNEDQSTLLIDLKKSLGHSDTAIDATNLINKFRKRKDLSGSVAAELDDVIASDAYREIREKAHSQHKGTTAGGTPSFSMTYKSILFWIILYLTMITTIAMADSDPFEVRLFMFILGASIFFGSITGSLFTLTKKYLYLALVGAFIGFVFSLIIFSGASSLLTLAIVYGIPGGIIMMGVLLRLIERN
ncbi:MAG: toll/interleukin-1 receptor domain-containing protein [Candidatus Thiodiazotropha sp.]